MFINSIILDRTSTKFFKYILSPSYDNLMYYTLNNYWIFNTQYEPYKHKLVYNQHIKKYGEEYANMRYERGKPLRDIWISRQHNNKIYPTQKPPKLMERIIMLSTV